MARTTRRTEPTLNLLTTKQVQHACDGDHSDGGGLLLRVRSDLCSWVMRYTPPTGSPGQSADSLIGARDAAHKAREQLRKGLDPIPEREQIREGKYS